MVGASEGGGGGFWKRQHRVQYQGLACHRRMQYCQSFTKGTAEKINNNKNRKISSDPQVVVGYRQCVAGCRMKMLAAS